MSRRELIKMIRQCGVPEVLIVELEISMAVKREITICCVVDRIIHHYNDTEKNEAIVSECLQRLLKIHFR